MSDQKSRRYIVLPDHGYTSDILADTPKLRATGNVAIAARPAQVGDGPAEMTVLDSLHENGPKLVEMSPQAELDLRAEVPGLKIVPLVRFERLRAVVTLDKTTETAASTVNVIVRDLTTNAPIVGARLLGFTNFRHRTGAEAVSNARGVARLALPEGTKLDRLYVFSPALYWNRLETSFVLNASNVLTVRPIDLSEQAGVLSKYAEKLPSDTGTQVRVGILDTGVQGNHPALPNVTGGRNMVFDETDADIGTVANWGPAEVDGDHGTHVAGIVGMRPTGKSALRGVAPGVQIRSYRVFPNNGEGATNYDIMSAIDRAVADDCHILNLSLGGGVADEATRSAIGHAADKGVLVIAAAGNDGRKPVSYPAAFPTCVAVSAMGLRNTFPSESSETADIAKPHGRDPEEFVAAFSNMGTQISFTGPGVGVISTVPSSAWGVMSGTSMACPAVAGFAAHILSQTPAIQAMDGPTRTRELRQALEKSARERGFGRDFEGFGLPQ